MNHATHDRLERDLGALTTWEGAPSALWERASGPGETRSGSAGRAAGLMSGLLSDLVPGGVSRAYAWKVAGAAAVAILSVGFLIGPALTSVGSARSRPPTASRVASSVDSSVADAARVPSSAPVLPSRDSAVLQRLDSGLTKSTPSAQGPASTSPQADVAPVRQVIRRAQMDLKVADVQVAFSKAAFLLSEARGEFVEESSLTGQAPQLTGTLRLRVASSRLGEVLTSLRGLGEVMGESSTGEDVTDQVVDVEARIRNEQRVEAELLALLESRRGAPLAEILQVRQSLASVRESSERLIAQRDRLSRLVSLSTILVTMQTDATEPTQGANGLMDRLGQSLRDAWESGAEALIDSLAFIVRVFIGGLLWWIVLGVIAISARLMWMRHVRGLAREPAPRGV